MICQMRGRRGLHQLLGPALQGLGQHGVVGVAHRVGDDVPGLVPAVALLVQQNAHQLGDDQGGVGVVDLDDVLPGEVAQGAVLGLVLADDGLHGGGDEEILLLQPQGLALGVVVVGVEDLGDDLGHGLLLHRLQVLAPVEEGEVHRVGAVGLPQPQHVALLGAVKRLVRAYINDLAVLQHIQAGLAVDEKRPSYRLPPQGRLPRNRCCTGR